MPNRRRKELEARKRKRRTVLFTGGVLLAVYLLLIIFAGDNGMTRYLKLRKSKAALRTEIITLEKQNKDISAQISSLSDKKSRGVVEELARDMGLTKEGEIIFKFEEER